MSVELDILVSLAGGCIGLYVGQCAGPVACLWPAKGTELALRLTQVKLNSHPSRLARAAGGLVLAGLLLGGPLVGYAAEPSAPEQLPGEAVGVVGSGDQLSLRVWANGQGRAVKVGEEYKDGWKLETLTPSVATLAKGGDHRQVGLNPTGAVPIQEPPARPPEVEVTLSAENLAAVQRVIDRGAWDGKTPIDGMSLGETRRYKAYTERSGQSLLAALARSGGPIQPTAADLNGGMTSAELADQAALRKIANTAEYNAAVARGDVNQARIYDGLAVLGPESFYQPPGMSLDQAAQAAGLMTAVGYQLGPPDADGGRTMTKAPALGRPLLQR